MDWKKHYTEQPAHFGETEFLKQVGKTVSGQPITPAQFEAQLSDISHALDPQKGDRMLDLCCGNGIITVRLSAFCASIVGVDFSEPLIELARKYNQADNIQYFCLSVLDPEICHLPGQPFNRIYMYEALQHLPEESFEGLLSNLKEISTPDAVIFFGGVPDLDHLWDFYDTPERREDYRIRKSRNEEAIGTWWKKSDFSAACAREGFDCGFPPQNPILHSAHYRFDARLTRKGG